MSFPLYQQRIYSIASGWVYAWTLTDTLLTANPDNAPDPVQAGSANLEGQVEAITVSADHTLNQRSVNVDTSGGSVAITLPPLGRTVGALYVVRKGDAANSVTFAAYPGSGDTIETSTALTADGETRVFYNEDGSQWNDAGIDTNLEDVENSNQWTFAKGDMLVDDGTKTAVLPAGTLNQVLTITGTNTPGWANLPVSTGEANTASNVGAGADIFKQKVGVDLEFRGVRAGSTKVTSVVASDNVEIDVVPGQIDHQDLSGAGTNTHAQIDSHIADTSNPHGTTAADLGLASGANKYDATGPPGLTDDSNAGTGTPLSFDVGSVWVDTTNGRQYVCLDPTPGAAVWKEVTNEEINDLLGAANGIATLDATGKVPASQLPISGLNFKGTWNAATNSPTLASGTGTVGDYYIVSADGSTTLDGENDWKQKDWVVFDGTVWRKIDNTDQVASVAGKTGVVTLDTSDVTEDPSNLYYTEARVSANADVAANTAHRNITSGNPHNVTAAEVGLAAANFGATTDPTANDDDSNTAGNGTFAVGSEWINTTTGFVFRCVDASTGAAVWVSNTPPRRYVFRDERSTGVQGGTFNKNTWVTRPLNTDDAINDPAADVTRAGNVLTFAAGTYRVRARAVAFKVDQHRVRFQQTNNTPGTLLGGFSARTNNGATESLAVGTFTIGTAGTTVELQHRCTNTRNNNGLGDAAGFPGLNELYALIEIERVS